MFSSQPQSETETEDKHEGVGREWKVRGKDMPSLIETLGLCYLGTILLRLPVSIGEMHRYVAWCLRFQMGVCLSSPNLQLGCQRRHSFHKGREIRTGRHEAKATRAVPQSTGYHGMNFPTVPKASLTLHLQSPLELDRLRKTIHNLSLFYTHHFGLTFPPLNVPLLLYKQIRCLSLPSMPLISRYHPSPSL